MNITGGLGDHWGPLSGFKCEMRSLGLNSAPRPAGNKPKNNDDDDDDECTQSRLEAETFCGSL